MLLGRLVCVLARLERRRERARSRRTATMLLVRGVVRRAWAGLGIGSRLYERLHGGRHLTRKYVGHTMTRHARFHVLPTWRPLRPLR